MQGILLYTSIGVSYYSGSFRFLSFKEFRKEIGLGFAIELIFTLGFLFI